GKDGISINGKDGTIGLKGEDGKDGIALNGKDGTIGINGKDGSNGKITVAQGKAGLDGNDGADGETKTRIVYEKPNGDKEEVATLNDGLKFTGNNEVVNSHKLNSLVTIKGEGVDKAASDAFKSAAGNVNVKADGKGTLEVQLAKDLKNIDSISNKDGQKIEFKDGGTTISGGNVSVDGNNITNVKAGKDDTDAVNVKQLKDGIAQATTKVAAGKNVNVTSAKNPDGSTTYTVATKDDVDFTSVTTGNTKMNDGGITIKAAEGGKTNVTLTNKGLDNGGNKVVNVAEGTNDTDAVNVKQLKAAKTEVEAGDNVVVTSTKGSNGQTIYKVNATDNSAHVDGSDAITVTKAPTTRKNGTTTVTDYKVDLSNKTKDDINKGVDAHYTVNNKGLTFNADKGTTGVKKLGSQVAVNGDNKNIETVADANGVKVKLKDDISVNTVTAKTIKAGDTTINDNGLTINNGPSVTKDGINAGGSRITNVAPGRDGTDAVNVNQLKKATNEIHNSLNKMDKRRKAGTASALATAGLMQAYREGQSSVTAGVGQYQNQSAVAVGYSRLSDNGKYGVKVSFTTNTQGEVGGTASAGYFW
ncbi:MAG: YadA-like family protein, partial [Staphylococcus simulans]|nr:YadA-like family protein [Staphylococcus simulans]